MAEDITPQRARALIEDGALLVDIREAGERAREYIPGSLHHPLSAIGEDGPARQAGAPVIFHCRSGLRTRSNADALKACAGREDIYLLTGGIGAWRAAGYETEGRPPADWSKYLVYALIAAFGYYATRWLLG